MSERLYLIDGYAQFFRAYHAIRSGLTSPITNEPTNMTFGFVGMLLKVLREEKPDYLAVILDVSGDRGTFRSQLYPAYKANRPPPPSDLYPQVQRCLTLLKLFGVPAFGCEGTEADDVIATLVRRYRRERPDLEIRIVSKDKDLGQLLDAKTKLYDVHTGQALGTAELFEKKGITPEQVVDMLALMGDTVDNVPGVAGVGPKTASQLITEFGSLDELLRRVTEVKGKKGEAIAAARETLALSRSLVVLKDDCAVAFELEDARVDPTKIRVAELDDAMRELGFGRHRDELKAIAGAPTRSTASASERGSEESSASAAGTLFASETADVLPPPPLPVGDYRAVRTVSELTAWLAAAREADVVAVDTETDSLVAHEATLAGVSLASSEGRGVYIPLRSPEPAAHLAPEEAISALRPFLEDPAWKKVGHNLKYDLNVLRNAGVRLAGIAGDSMVESYLVDATRSSHSLDALAENLLGYRTLPIAAVFASIPHHATDGRSPTFAEAPLAIAVPYAAEDADVALRLHHVLAAQIEEKGLKSLNADVELPLVEVLAELEWNGIRVDSAELDGQRDAIQLRIDGLRREISALAPTPFNPDSPKQLAAILFNKPDAALPGLGLKPVKKTKTGFSTDVEVLEKLAEDPEVSHPLPAKIVEYRQLTKLVGTYLVALKEAISRKTGRVHASFHQTVTATGRLSSSDPNLQNIPIRSDVGRDIRKAFRADPGMLLLAADYSQIELRLLAHLSGDPALIAAFQAGADIHAAVAAEVFGVDQANVNEEMRHGAKMVNFGIIYGITAYGLARRLGRGVSRERAQQIIDDYHKRFPRIAAFLEACVAKARADGFVSTILGRRRPTPQIFSKSPPERAFGERIAINTVVQGSAADLIKVAMVRLYRALPTRFPKVRMLLQIHDELVFEVPEGEIDAARDFIVDAMEHALPLAVPLKVESGSGRDWRAC